MIWPPYLPRFGLGGSEISPCLYASWEGMFSLPPFSAILTFALLSSPHFEYYVDLYQNVLSSKTKLQYLIDGIIEVGGTESDFWGYQNKVRKVCS